MYEQGIAAAPFDVSLHRSLGDLDRELGDYSAAEVEYRRAIELQGEDLELLLNLAVTLAHQGRLEEAAATLEQARQIEGSNVRVLAALGQVFYRMERYREADDLLEQALFLDPSTPSAHLYRALTLLEMGDSKAAVKEAQMAIAEEPSSSLCKEVLDRAQTELRQSEGML